MAGRCVVAYESDKDKDEALTRIKAKIDANGKKPSLIMFFADNASFSWYARSIYEAYPDCVTIGSSTDINITSEGYGASGVSVMALYDNLEIGAGILLDVTRYPLKYADNISEALSNISDTNNTVCVEFTTANGKSEEIVLDTLRSVLEKENIPVFGSSSSTPTDVMTCVSLNGTVYSEGSVFVLIHNMNGRIFLYKENMYKPTGFKFTATDVDCEDRRVYEFDSRPAVSVIKEALNMPIDELKERMASHPLGRIIEDEILITDAADIADDGSIGYFARIYNCTKMVLLEPEDIATVWDRTRTEIARENLHSEFMIVVNCATRSKIFTKDGLMQDFSNVLLSICPQYVGCSGLGEQLGYEHLNQTCVLAIFE